MATRTKGPWNHRQCAEHRKVEGYTKKVCVLPGQDGDEVEHFASALYRLAKAFRRRLLKPATKRRTFDMHDVCGGHLEFPYMGKLCYGTKGMTPERLSVERTEVANFAKEIAKIRDSNPRYARFYTGNIWR